MPHAHYRTLCDCGAVIVQCRCRAKDKVVSTIAAGCEECQRGTPVYAAELAVAGLAAKIRSDTSVAMAAVAVPDDDPAAATQAIAFCRESASGTNLDQDDLFYLKSVLVSTGLNKNDDYFEREETWAARSTPEDKPFNYEHKTDDIIGHITACRAVGVDGTSLPDNSDIPDRFHLLTTAVVYRRYDVPERQKRTDTMIAEIGQGKWFVSMECLFRGFDYLLVPEDASQAGGVDLTQAKLVARGEDTAFLTKHLRAYGGSGRWNGHKLGRVLRNILFSGKGLVRQPANPDSLIFTLDEKPLSGAAAEIRTPPAESGYGTAAAVLPRPNEERMNDIDTLKAQLAEANEKLAKADAKAAEALKAEVASAKIAVEAAEEKAKAHADAREKAEAALKVAVEAKDAAVTAKATLESQLATLAAAKRQGDRVAKVKDAYGVDAAEADAIVADLDEMSDEKFDRHVVAMTKKVQVGASKVSDLPAPAGGGSKLIKTIPTGGTPVPPQAGGTKTATAADLDAAVPTPDAALATTAETPNQTHEFEQTQADILAYFGEDEKAPSGGEK